jgi:anti-anti-sigma factor
MAFEIYRSPDSLYLRIGGRFVLDDCISFKESMAPLMAAKVAMCAIDLSATEFIDSAGLGALVGMKVKASQDGFRLVLVSPSGPIGDILTVSKLSNIFDIVTGLEAETLRAAIARPEYRIRGPQETTVGGLAPERTTGLEEEIRLADEAMRQADYVKAAEHYGNVVKIDDRNLSACNNLAVVYEKRPEWREKAIAQWERVLALSRKMNDVDHFERAQKHLRQLHES